MDQYQTLSYMQLALNTNAVYTVGTLFILWAAFRFAGRLREGESNVVGKVLTSIFGLMIIWNGLVLFGNRNYSISTATASLKSIKASGQALGTQAEGLLNHPMMMKVAENNPQFGLFNDIPTVIFWLVVTLMLLGTIWMPVKSKKKKIVNAHLS